MKYWEKYEKVAAELLDRFASDFGLERVEGKQKIAGESGTEWEIDAKGFRDDEGEFLIVECRRHTTSSQSQEQVGGLGTENGVRESDGINRHGIGNARVLQRRSSQSLWPRPIRCRG